jgi:hypothetical protein
VSRRLLLFYTEGYQKNKIAIVKEYSTTSERISIEFSLKQGVLNYFEDKIKHFVLNVPIFVA